LKLLDGGGITAGASPKSVSLEQPMQVTQNRCRKPRSPQRHCGANAGIEHPRRQRSYDACFDLNMYQASTGALLAVVNLYRTTVVRMPAVMNYNFLPDMGRMTA
jgi:hypothetical protein